MYLAPVVVVVVATTILLIKMTGSDVQTDVVNANSQTPASNLTPAMSLLGNLKATISQLQPLPAIWG